MGDGSHLKKEVRIMLEIQIILQNFLQTADMVNDY